MNTTKPENAAQPMADEEMTKCSSKFEENFRRNFFRESSSKDHYDEDAILGNLVYGPPQKLRTYTCKKCGFSEKMNDWDDHACPQCGEEMEKTP